MISEPCAFPDCANTRRTSQEPLCVSHYNQKRRGEDLRPLRGRHKTYAQAFQEYVTKGPGCWGWTGQKDHKGYSLMCSRSRAVRAHRWSYEQSHGPIPDGMVVDHICHNRECTNPAHLRLATNQDNSAYRRGANRTNTSGVRGVSRSGRKWKAMVGHAGKVHYLGSYATIDEAAEVVRAKRAELHTFPTN